MAQDLPKYPLLPLESVSKLKSPALKQNLADLQDLCKLRDLGYQPEGATSPRIQEQMVVIEKELKNRDNRTPSSKTKNIS